ncbi:hypothetical protein F3Y22_tig00110809pilonHSYRG00248 [Hibiscus syriacus]|uniref:Uncharacterized protein n=1 Tax=Hibiscus syriacus TaxID=106335 RepID=A0A6A2ZPC8_HIBSY|nr:hypothetical protein F3Y22_tig00110809pilonHSYRG00248 [Hibiscus syriacus]
MAALTLIISILQEREVLGVLSTHSNPKILKSNKKSRFGQRITPYDTDEEEDVDEEFGEKDDGMVGDDWLMNDDFAQPHEYFINWKKVKSHKGSGKEGNQGRKNNARDRKFYHTSNKMKEAGSLGVDEGRKMVSKISKESRYQRLSDEIDLDEKWFPLLDYLMENNLKSHVAFLMGLGIPNCRIGQIIARAPSLFSYRVENSVKPTVRYLIEEVGINEHDLGKVKVVQLSPQILIQRIDISWNTCYMFSPRSLEHPEIVL